MKAGKETAMYKQGYRDGYNDGENAHIDPDYWTRLEHQYAGMAMQGMLVSHRINSILENGDVIPTGIAMLSRSIAHALV